MNPTTNPCQARLFSAYDLLSRVQYCPQIPTVKQAAFLSLDCGEAFFGGAAGPGKSSSLLMAATQFVDVPGYSALLIRRSYQELIKKGAIMDRALDWWRNHPDVRWDASNHRFTFPSGATISFGYLAKANDHLQYNSAEFQYIAFDELTHFPRYQYEYMFTRLRRLKGVRIPIRMRSGSNPGGPGHMWVKERFVDAKTRDRRAAFIPALMTDNPHLDIDEYREVLSRLDEVTRKRMEDGDWFVTRSGLVHPAFETCVVPDRPIPAGERYGGIDWGWTNPFAAVMGVLDHDDVLWLVAERYKSKRTVPQHAASLARYKDHTFYAGPDRPEDIQLLRLHDFVCHPGPNSVASGIDLVNERIRDGRLKVFESLSSSRAEAGLYSLEDEEEDEVVEDKDEERDRVDPGQVKNKREIPVDKHNHAMAAVRYMVAGISKMYGIDKPIPEDDDGDDEPSAEEKAAIEEEEREAEKEFRSSANERWWRG